MATDVKPLSIKACYSKAWKAFAKWWIPICLIAGFLMAFEWIPKQFVTPDSQSLNQRVTEIVETYNQGDMDRLEVMVTELNEDLMAYAKKMVIFSLYIAPFALVFTILLLATSLMAVKNQHIRYAPKRMVVVALTHLVIAFVKVLLIFLILPLGMYVYVKLSFVSLLMLDNEQSPTAAVRESWSMTEGNFWPLFGIVAINGTLQIAMIPTVIGLIPATGISNTARAAAFTMLRSARTDLA
ncbi:MAG: hypothetical protein K9M54_07715 [Kiritimatiellales bacterium]|nr:hypothetical protein [Kiritimatiellales bacterium]MCF7863380.1 hypothetical protein [Kiritimatiellales bacterium]